MHKQKFDNGYTDRVKRLSDRLSSMTAVSDPDKSSRYSDLEKRLDALDKEFEEISEQNNKKFLILKENITKLERKIEEEFQNRDHFFQSKTAEISSFQEEVHESVAKYLKAKKEAEVKVYKMIEDKFEGLKSRLLEESKNFKESESEIKNSIEQDMPKLFEFVQSSLIERHENEASLTKKVENAIGNIENDLVIETKTREETEEAMISMIRDVISRIKNDLEIERKARESSEESLLGLLEETCSKISLVTNY